MDEGVENGRPLLGTNSAGGGSTPASLPPDSQMANYTIPGVLHFVKHEWSRFEKERAAWEVEKAELQTKIAFLQGERRGHENLMKDLVRRIKMLEFALKQERAKLYKMQLKKEIKFGDMSPPAKEPDKSDVAMDIAAIVSQKEESRRLLREYLKEVGFSDTVLEARVSRINAYRTLYSQNQIEPSHTTAMLANSVTAVTISPANPPSLHPSPSSPSSSQLLPNGPIIANGTDTQVQGGSSALAGPGPHPLEEEEKRDNEPPVGGDMMAEDQALASFDFLGTTGDSDSDEEEEEEDEEEERDDDEGDPTVSVEDEFTAGFVNAVEPTGDHQEGWQLTSEISRYQESKARRGKSSQPFQRPSRKAMDKLRNLSEAGSGVKGEGQRGGVSSPRALVEPVFPLPTHSEEKIGADRLGDLASLVEFNPESTVMGPPSHESTKKWDVKFSMRGHFDVVTSLSFHPVEPLLLTGSQDCSLKLWSLHCKKPSAHWVDLEPIHTFRGHRGGVLCVVMGVNGDICFSGSADSNIRVWRVPSADADPYSNYDPEEHQGVLQGHSDAIWDLAVHHKSGLLLSCSADGSVRLWNHTLTSPQVKQFDAEPGYRCPTAVDFLSTDPNHLVVSYSAAKTVIYDIETAKPVVYLDSGTTYDGTPNTQINKVVAHPTLPVVVTGHEDKYIRFYDTVSGNVVHSMTAHMDSVTGLTVDPHGLYLLSGSHDGSLRFWDFDSKACIQEVPAHRKHYDEAIFNVTCHPSKPFFASAGADGIAKVLE